MAGVSEGERARSICRAGGGGVPPGSQGATELAQVRHRLLSARPRLGPLGSRHRRNLAGRPAPGHPRSPGNRGNRRTRPPGGQRRPPYAGKTRHVKDRPGDTTTARSTRQPHVRLKPRYPPLSADDRERAVAALRAGSAARLGRPYAVQPAAAVLVRKSPTGRTGAAQDGLHAQGGFAGRTAWSHSRRRRSPALVPGRSPSSDGQHDADGHRDTDEVMRRTRILTAPSPDLPAECDPVPCRACPFDRVVAQRRAPAMLRISG